MTFSQHDFSKVDPIIYLTYFLYNFNEVERVLLSIQCLSDFYKVEKCFVFKGLPLDFYKVERDVLSSLGLSTLIKSTEICFQAFADRLL